MANPFRPSDAEEGDKDEIGRKKAKLMMRKRTKICAEMEPNIGSMTICLNNSD
jgi:hypothetical protein